MAATRAGPASSRGQATLKDLASCAAIAGRRGLLAPDHVLASICAAMRSCGPAQVKFKGQVLPVARLQVALGEAGAAAA
jgi:hypothetical protein